MSELRATPRNAVGIFNSQEERIATLEKIFKMRVYPVGKTDTLVIGLSSAIFGVTFIFMVIAWSKYKYRPIRAKNMLLTTCMFFSGIMWFVGDIPMNGHVLLEGPWRLCKFWNVWVRVLFCFIYTTVLFSRCYALDRVFNQNKPTSGWAYYAPSVLLFAFIIIYSIVTQVMPDRLTIGYREDYELCTTTDGYVIVTLTMLWANWLIIIAMMYRLRNIQSTFNEFYEFLCISFFGIAAMIKTNVVHYTHAKYPYTLGYRVAETIGDVIIINGIILLIIGYPVVMSIIRPREYEREWLLRLRTDGLQDMYEGNFNVRTDGPLHYLRMSSSVSNQADKALCESAANGDQSFIIQGFGHPIDNGDSAGVNSGYFPIKGMSAATPHTSHNQIMRGFDNSSVKSVETIDDVAKDRHIL
ncbi:hypothetical protein BX661DRAFT_189576 [Kickxella alabastrina]|uniref:uncharacterized protein n=1 Tax=Kickxella alabastrina TaxID=61397 RepID=UPI002220015E|nr:uncharacterized protein BX661DRAFT_189576 [Kickxella alabastrina]KAI7819978.1 hypothetical protein BX661DRAFT_189576 [Kickxella alabastrina]